MWAGDVPWDPFIFRFVFDIVSAEAFPHKIIWEWAGAEISWDAYVWDWLK